ncbi:VC_2705 family sodium/solute symporter [Polaromonas sp.]|uniref:VC_2705 family sodium/solute symporter n=1 Tax=Polaromonas sp. TaxID=1869339 RepID=UPI0025EA33C8|nr:VC_2705 family sodium/solute symporter [Polaromonas sp.]
MFLFAVFGGMKGITYTQVAQYIVLIIAYTVPAVFISLQLTGNAIPQLGLGSGFSGTDMSLLAKLDSVVTDLGFGQYTTTTAGSTLNMFMYTLSLMIGTAGLPHVIMRFFTVPSVKDARSSAGWALVFIAILYTTAPAVAAMAKLNLHATVNTAVKAGGDLYAPEASIKNEDRPDWMKRWEKTGLLKFEDKNGDGRIQYYNDTSKNAAATAKATAAGWKGNELTVNPDIIVLANPEIALLPNWVIALVAAGGLAAALSTAAGLLMAISSAVSHDLVKNIFMPGISEKGELMAGLFITLFYVFAHKGIFFIKGTDFLPMIGGANSFFGITPEAFGAVGAMVNFVVAFLVDKVTKEPPAHIQAMVEAVRIPRGSSAVTGGH